MIKINDLSKNPNPLSEHYSNFKVNERILLTGHSHQAWPDCALEGILEAWKDACLSVDDKWEKAFRKADGVRKYLAELMDDEPNNIVLGQSTHDLLIKFLSALDLKNRRKIITTDGEFHSARRQFDRLSQGWLDIVKISKEPLDTLSERIAENIDKYTAAVMISKVMYQDAAIVEKTEILEEACLQKGACLIIDAYHVLNAIPFSLNKENFTRSVIVGGGYKYLQLGEGNSFMRIPPDTEFKPVITGWFSEFAALSDKKVLGEVPYGHGHWAFAGATYDPVSHYRAERVLRFFREKNLTPELLRELNLHQKKILAERFDGLGFDESKITREKRMPLDKYGAFQVFISPYAGKICSELKKHNIYTDYRGDNLRLGPAPFLSDTQIIRAVEIMKKITEEL